MSLNTLAKSIHKGNVKRGFWDGEKNVGELLMLVVSELSEALEADRKGKKALAKEFEARKKAVEQSKANGTLTSSEYSLIFTHYIKDTFEDEIADAVIRLLDLSAGLGIDIDAHVCYKLEYNATRPYKHGKKY